MASKMKRKINLNLVEKVIEECVSQSELVTISSFEDIAQIF